MIDSSYNSLYNINMRKVDQSYSILEIGHDHSDGCDSPYFMVAARLGKWYTVRKGQSQVGEEIDAELARAAVSLSI